MTVIKNQKEDHETLHAIFLTYVKTLPKLKLAAIGRLLSEAVRGEPLYSLEGDSILGEKIRRVDHVAGELWELWFQYRVSMLRGKLAWELVDGFSFEVCNTCGEHPGVDDMGDCIGARNHLCHDCERAAAAFRRQHQLAEEAQKEKS